MKSIVEKQAKEYIAVRYMGPKFAIVFSGIDINAVSDFMLDLKQKIEKVKIKFIDNEEQTEDEENKKEASPKINIIVSTYYKGTALEGLTKKLEEYLDNAPKNENTINYL